MDADQAVYHPGKRVAFRKIGDRIVIVLPTEEKLLTLNETATAIWEGLSEQTVEEIARRIASEFEVTFEDALEDVRSFLTEMTDRGILEPRDREETGP